VAGGNKQRQQAKEGPAPVTAVSELDLPVIDLASEEYEADPYEVFAAARRQSWLARVGKGYGVLTHADAKALFRHPDFRVSFSYIDRSLSEYLYQRSRSGLMNMHGEEHARLRSTASRALRSRFLDSLRSPMHHIANELLDKALAAGGGDFVEQVVGPYPALVMAPILGVPFSDIPDIDRWASDSVAIFDSTRLAEQAPKIERAARELDAYVGELIAERRRNLGNDVVSELVRAQEGEAKLTEAELAMLVSSLVPAALDTTRGQLGFTVQCLVSDPGQWAKLVEAPDLAEKAVEEGLRFAPAISGIPHQAVRDTSYNGVEFPAGTLVAIYPRSANRDPAAVRDPGTFDIGREQVTQYTFGFGPHACLGAPVARIEMAEALRAMAKRIRTWELAGEVTHQPMSSNGNRLSMPVRFTSLVGQA
jgi:cytochrome P450